MKGALFMKQYGGVDNIYCIIRYVSFLIVIFSFNMACLYYGSGGSLYKLLHVNLWRLVRELDELVDHIEV